MHISSEWYNRALALKEKFSLFGECVPAVREKIPDHAPESLRALLSVSGEWHIMSQHYGVYGCNLFNKGSFLERISIFGDEDLLKEWKTDHASPNCAENGWEVFGAVSEFDYLCVCLDIHSSSYGQVRHIVNNCWEDISFFDSFNEFVEHLESYVDCWLSRYNLSDNVDNEEKQLPNFFSF